jgi:GT2 family glycosyltransferase
VVIAPKNDFLFSLNAVVKSRREELVVILNNDMILDADCLRQVKPWFADPAIFAATCRIYNWNGVDRFETTPAHLCTFHVQNGWFQEQYDTAPDYPCYVQLASGGASAYRRDLFCELGGFDPLFHPIYFEDNDLSYRAWQGGWRVILDPRSVVYHLESATMKREAGSRIRLICGRNRILFMAKNLGGHAFLLRFLALYFKRVLQHRFGGDRELARALFAALPRLPKALCHRAQYRWRHPVLCSDSEIAALSGQPYAPDRPARA